MTNPYSPTTPGAALARPKSNERSGNVFLHVFFLVGCIIGLHVGAVIESGLESTIGRTRVNPIWAMQFFAIFSVCCFLITLAWRIPRRLLFGSHRLCWFGSLAGGITFVGGPYVATVLYSWSPFGTPPIGAPWLLPVMLVAMFVILSVELEAWLGSLGNAGLYHEIAEPSHAP